MVKGKKSHCGAFAAAAFTAYCNFHYDTSIKISFLSGMGYPGYAVCWVLRPEIQNHSYHIRCLRRIFRPYQIFPQVRRNVDREPRLWLWRFLRPYTLTYLSLPHRLRFAITFSNAALTGELSGRFAMGFPSQSKR